MYQTASSKTGMDTPSPHALLVVVATVTVLITLSMGAFAGLLPS